MMVRNLYQDRKWHCEILSISFQYRRRQDGVSQKQKKRRQVARYFTVGNISVTTLNTLCKNQRELAMPKNKLSLCNKNNTIFWFGDRRCLHGVDHGFQTSKKGRYDEVSKRQFTVYVSSQQCSLTQENENNVEHISEDRYSTRWWLNISINASSPCFLSNLMVTWLLNRCKS